MIIVRFLLIYSIDFNACTDRARICLKNNVVLKLLLKRRAKAQQEIKNGLVEGL